MTAAPVPPLTLFLRAIHRPRLSVSCANDKRTLFLLLDPFEQHALAFTSVADLPCAIMDYLDHHNADPKPFIWTKSAGEILEKVARAKQALESQH